MFAYLYTATHSISLDKIRKYGSISLSTQAVTITNADKQRSLWYIYIPPYGCLHRDVTVYQRVHTDLRGEYI